MRATQVPSDMIEYSSFGSAVDLYTTKLRPAYILKVTGAGTLVCKMSNSGGTSRTFNVTDGETLLGEFMTIESVSGVTRVRAGWN